MNLKWRTDFLFINKKYVSKVCFEEFLWIWAIGMRGEPEIKFIFYRQNQIWVSVLPIHSILCTSITIIALNLLEIHTTLWRHHLIRSLNSQTKQQFLKYFTQNSIFRPKDECSARLSSILYFSLILTQNHLKMILKHHLSKNFMQYFRNVK